MNNDALVKIILNQQEVIDSLNEEIANLLNCLAAKTDKNEEN